MKDKKIEKINVFREDRENRLGCREPLHIEEQIKELQDKINEIIAHLNQEEK